MWVGSLGQKDPLEVGNGNPLQYSCLGNPMNSMKRQKDMTLEDEPPRLESVQNATGEVGAWMLIRVQLFAAP